jgi:hypothetical protein
MSLSFPNSRGSDKCQWYTIGRKMSDNNLEQLINFKFCVRIHKSSGETLALLTLAFDEYAMKKISVFEWRCSSRKEEKTCNMTQEMGSQKCKGMWQWRVFQRLQQLLMHRCSNAFTGPFRELNCYTFVSIYDIFFISVHIKYRTDIPVPMGPLKLQTIL